MRKKAEDFGNGSYSSVDENALQDGTQTYQNEIDTAGPQNGEGQGNVPDYGELNHMNGTSEGESGLTDENGTPTYRQRYWNGDHDVAGEDDTTTPYGQEMVGDNFADTVASHSVLDLLVEAEQTGRWKGTCSFPSCKTKPSEGYKKCNHHLKKDVQYSQYRRKESGCSHCKTTPHKEWCRTQKQPDLSNAPKLKEPATMEPAEPKIPIAASKSVLNLLKTAKIACGKCGRTDYNDIRGRLCDKCAFPDKKAELTNYEHDETDFLSQGSTAGGVADSPQITDDGHAPEEFVSNEQNIVNNPHPLQEDDHQDGAMMRDPDLINKDEEDRGNDAQPFKRDMFAAKVNPAFLKVFSRSAKELRRFAGENMADQLEQMDDEVQTKHDSMKQDSDPGYESGDGRTMDDNPMQGYSGDEYETELFGGVNHASKSVLDLLKTAEPEGWMNVPFRPSLSEQPPRPTNSQELNKMTHDMAPEVARPRVQKKKTDTTPVPYTGPDYEGGAGGSYRKVTNPKAPVTQQEMWQDISNLNGPENDMTYDRITPMEFGTSAPSWMGNQLISNPKNPVHRNFNKLISENAQNDSVLDLLKKATWTEVTPSANPNSGPSEDFNEDDDANAMGAPYGAMSDGKLFPGAEPGEGGPQEADKEPNDATRIRKTLPYQGGKVEDDDADLYFGTSGTGGELGNGGDGKSFSGIDSTN